MVVPEHDHDGESKDVGDHGGTTPQLFVTVLNLLMAAERARI